MSVHDDYYDGERKVPLLPGVGKARRQNVDIEVNGPTGRVSIGGEPLKGVRGFTYRASMHEMPSIELDLLVHDVTRLGSKDTEILLPDSTVEALIALGWTPPEERSGDPNRSQI
ncbi:hypothetical protein ABT007_00845 [Streptomyces griseus]|uniref:hypothetical protein n=1 Tax=Streptomyces griseus TaxID=1911 RepID=UPI00331742E5